MSIEWIVALVVIAGVLGYGLSVLIKNRTIRGLQKDIEELKIKVGIKYKEVMAVGIELTGLKQENVALKQDCEEKATKLKESEEKVVKVGKELKVAKEDSVKLADDNTTANKASLRIVKENAQLRKDKKTLEDTVKKLEDKPTGKPSEKKATKPTTKKADAKPTTVTKVGRKLDCPKIVEARAKAAKGEDVSDLAIALGVSASTLKRAIDSTTYKECKDPAVETKAPVKPSVKKDTKASDKKDVTKIVRRSNNKKGGKK